MILTQTPLRISLAGGGTDFPGFYEQEPGVVVSAAISRCVYVLIKERPDDLIIVSYSKREEVEIIDDLKHELVREAMRMTGVLGGVEIHTLADIRSGGSGLGSSSSLTVGLLNALHQYNGVQVAAERLAQEACEIEINICGKPIGKQDQYIAAYGGLCKFEFQKDGEVVLWKSGLSGFRYEQLRENFLLFSTGITRRAEDILEEQQQNMGKSRSALRDIKRLALETWHAVLMNNYEVIGKILQESWELKKSLAESITTPAIDKMYETALDAGAIGGKICGAGGGGHLLLFVPVDKKESVRTALDQFHEVPFAFERDGSKVIFNARRS